MQVLISWAVVAMVLGGALKVLGAAIVAMAAGATEVGTMALAPVALSLVALPIRSLMR